MSYSPQTIINKLKEKLNQFPNDLGLYDRGLQDGYINAIKIIESLTNTETCILHSIDINNKCFKCGQTIHNTQ